MKFIILYIKKIADKNVIAQKYFTQICLNGQLKRIVSQTSQHYQILKSPVPEHSKLFHLLIETF
jgi:hypothetical protein